MNISLKKGVNFFNYPDIFGLGKQVNAPATEQELFSG